MWQIGLVAFGTLECGIGYPGVFTNVSHYLPWIVKNLEA